MKDKLKKWTIDLIGEGYKWILLGIVGYLLSITGILQLKDILQKPIALWVVILICLSMLFGCAILFLIHSYRPPKNKIGFVDDKKYRWKVTVKPNGNYEVHDIPFCITHDRLFVKDVENYICSHDEKGKFCTNSIEDGSRKSFHKSATSLAEKEIRTKKIKLR